MNYVDPSGIYPIRNVVYVFWEVIVNPPGLLILGSDQRSSPSLVDFNEVGGW